MNYIDEEIERLEVEVKETNEEWLNAKTGSINGKLALKQNRISEKELRQLKLLKAQAQMIIDGLREEKHINKSIDTDPMNLLKRF
jgi:hypothetical protein